MKKRVLAIVMSVMLILLAGCEDKEYPKHTLSTEETKHTVDKQYNDTVQLTETDIQKMNDNKAVFVYSDENYVTTLVGKYYDEKINDYEDAVESLNGVASLIGLSAGSEFFCVFGEQDSKGYTYYTFQQKYGGLTLQYATLKVIVDPEGYAAGLSCSFTPDVGIAEEKTFISAAQAEAIS